MSLLAGTAAGTGEGADAHSLVCGRHGRLRQCQQKVLLAHAARTNATIALQHYRLPSRHDAARSCTGCVTHDNRQSTQADVRSMLLPPQARVPSFKFSRIPIPQRAGRAHGAGRGSRLIRGFFSISLRPSIRAAIIEPTPATATAHSTAAHWRSASPRISGITCQRAPTPMVAKADSETVHCTV